MGLLTPNPRVAQPGVVEAPDQLWVPAQHPCHVNLQLLGDFGGFYLQKARIHPYCPPNKSAHCVAEVSYFIRLEPQLGCF